MPKITQGAGATHGDDYVPALDEGDEPAHFAVDEAPADEDVEPTEPVVSDEEISVALSGSVPSILAWVNGDRELAARVLAAEKAQASPRTSLIAELEKLTR